MAGLARRVPSRRLPPRAALLSLALHAVVVAALLSVREDVPRSARPAVVQAVFLQMKGSAIAHEPRAPSEIVEPSAEETPAPPEPVEEKTAEARPGASRPAKPSPETAPAPSSDTPATTREPHQSRAEPAESRAEAIPAPPQPGSDQAAPTPAESREITPPASVAATTPREPPREKEPPESSAPVDTAEPTPESNTLPMDSKQEKMIEKRFSSLTRAFAADEPLSSMSWKSGGQEYTAQLEQQYSSDPTGTDHVVIEISTVENGARLSTKLRMKRLAFSDFAQFVDRWDPDVQMHADEIDGRFHSNDEINASTFGKMPIFRGHVTTAAREWNMDGRGSWAPRKMFPAGIEWGASRIFLPKDFLPFPRGESARDDQIERFEHDARIVFYPDGTYVVRSPGNPSKMLARHTLAQPAHYLLAADDATLYVSGVVHGKVLVYSPEKIVIERNLVYATAPNVAGADDYLGLVSDRTIEIAEPDVTGPGDLRIDASIYARSRFVVHDYLSRPSGTLIVRGALAAGSISATEPRYATRVVFDKRLEHTRAPSFPVTDRYELEPWDGVWTAGPADSPASGALNAFQPPN
jgi:hypothetical protein